MAASDAKCWKAARRASKTKKKVSSAGFASCQTALLCWRRCFAETPHCFTPRSRADCGSISFTEVFFLKAEPLFFFIPNLTPKDEK